MKIELKKDQSSYVLAGNSIYTEPINFTLNGHRHYQIVRNIEASTAQIFDRKNVQTQIHFEVGCRHKSMQEAQIQILNNAELFSEIKVTLCLDIDEKRHFVLEQAIITEIATHSKGNASYITYNILGGYLHATK